eukprot:scaffold539_cov187-Ochromonas_danica.AAC.3
MKAALNVEKPTRRFNLMLIEKSYYNTKTMKLFQTYLPHILSLSGQLCFSGWHIVGSLALQKGAANPLEALRIEKEDLGRFFFLGICSFVNVVGAVFALQYISATRFSIFQPAIPCIATVVSIFVGLDKATWIKLVGIAMAVSGAVLAEAWSTSNDDEKNVIAGSVLSSIQVTGMSLLIVFSKPMLTKYPSSVVTLAYYGMGTALTAVLVSAWACVGLFEAGDFVFHYERLSWLALAYASVMATAYTYNVLSWAGQRLSPSLVTVYCTFQPVGTIILSYVILSEVASPTEGLGAFIVICGLLVTVFGGHSLLGGEEETTGSNNPSLRYLKLYSEEDVEEVASEDIQD